MGCAGGCRDRDPRRDWDWRGLERIERGAKQPSGFEQRHSNSQTGLYVRRGIASTASGPERESEYGSSGRPERGDEALADHPVAIEEGPARDARRNPES